MANENVKPVTEEMLEGEKATEQEPTETPKIDPAPKAIVTPDETSTDEGKESGKQKGLSQEKVNELVGKARTEGKETGMKSLLEELGYDSPDTLKESLKEYQEFKRGQMSEMEKLQSDFQKLQEEKARLEETTSETRSQAELALLRAEVNKLAGPRFEDVDVVWKVLNHDDFKINLDEGTVTGVENSLDNLAEQYPWMLSKGSKVSQTSRTNPQNPNRKIGRTNDQRRAEYFGTAGNDFWDTNEDHVRVIAEE